jgi:Helicase HerA, central domain
MVGTRTSDTSKIVALDAEGLLHHTLIVGQSGSGKSFFVARLVEEIILATSARVVIVDPNGDFRAITNPNPASFTEYAGRFGTVKGKRHPDFDDAATFVATWGQRRFLGLHPNTSVLPEDQAVSLNRRLVVHWEALDEVDRDFLIRLEQPLGAQVRTGLDACVAYAQFLSEKYPTQYTDLRGLMNVADQFVARNVSLLHYPQVKDLTTEDWVGVRSTFADLLQRYTVWSSGSAESIEPRAIGLAEYVDGPFQSAAPSSQLYWDVLTLALDAARESDSLLIVDTLLARLWRNAKTAWRRATNYKIAGEDSRVPTFIIIDEAQNFAPADTSNPLRRRVTERLLQIASEGRKYGLYLILASQRPTKLHSSLVPECENSCVLRVQSSLDIRFAIDALGIEEKLARNCPSFTKGRGVVSGRWLDSDVGVDTQFIPARTVVGGGGLPDTWRVRTNPSAPFALHDPMVTVREVIMAELNAAKEPIALVELAEVVRTEFPEVERNGWLGRATFKSLLLDVGVANLLISNTGPGYAYLQGIHEAPTSWAPDSIPDGVRGALIELHRQKSTPLLGAKTFASILNTLSEIVQESVFNFTEVSRTVRDQMLKGSQRAARSSISYVIKGITFGGHRFEPDLPQDASTLAAAFVRSLRKGLQITVPLEGDALARALVHCTGEILDRDAVTRLITQASLGVKDEPITSVGGNEAVMEAIALTSPPDQA